MIQPFLYRGISKFKESAALRLLETIKQSEFDVNMFSSLIYMAINNGHTQIVDQVFDFLSAEQLVESLLIETRFGVPLKLTIKVRENTVLKKIIAKIESSKDKDKLKKQVVDFIVYKHNKKRKILSVSDDEASHEMLEIFSKNFTSFKKLMPILGELIIELNDETLFQLFFEENSKILTDTNAIGSLALKAAECVNISILIYISEQSPASIDVLNEKGESPLLLADTVDYDNFVKLWNLSEANRMKASIAHKAIDNSDIGILRYIFEQAPVYLKQLIVMK